jgi:hypothetical protein
LQQRQESIVQVYQIILLIWAIVFAVWYMKQVSDFNKRKDEELEAENQQ